VSTATILWIIAAIVVIAIVATLFTLRARRRRAAARAHIGLPDLGALSTDGLDKEHAAGDRHRAVRE
jgi:hypothetical protein